MQLQKILLVLGAGYSVSACNTNQTLPDSSAPAIHLVRNSRYMGDMTGFSFISNPQLSNFTVCHGNTCRYISKVSLSNDEWRPIKELFDRTANGPEEEREQIGQAIALLETIVGEKTGTSNDKAENMEGFGENGQMDCVDESTNTSVYLTLLQNAGLLQWHVVDHRVSRGVLSLKPPHFTAVVREKQNNERYAVDSWFLKNGESPYIVPLSSWKKGWKPVSK